MTAPEGMQMVPDEMQKVLNEMTSGLMSFQIPECPGMEAGLKQLIGAGGKRLRPGLAWICYQLGPDRKLPIQPLMCMLELMHTASLIHDDIVDNAAIRRGVETIQVRSGKRMAAESGDYLLGLAMGHLKVYRGTGINERLADVSEQMCIGELTEMQNLFQADHQNEETCMEQIRKKTAALIAGSCYCGAVAGGLPKEQKEALASYGEYIGIAFQLQDDLLDITAEAGFGKTRGQDLRNGIFTLPILHAFSTMPDSAMVSLAEKKEKNDSDVEKLIQYIIEADGIGYTKQRISDVTQKALASLAWLPDGKEKQLLISMAEALRQRKI